MKKQATTVTKLPSGFYHVRGHGPCNWAQPPNWPCSENDLREYAFPQASEEFFQSAMRLVSTWSASELVREREKQ